MSHPKLKSLSHPKLLYVFKPNDCDKNDFFYSHANETYYRKKDLHLALLGKWGLTFVDSPRKLLVDNAYFVLITNINYEKIN